MLERLVNVGYGGCCLWLGTCERSWHSHASCYGCGSPVAVAALENAASLLAENEKSQNLLENLHNAPTHHREEKRENGGKKETNVSECGLNWICYTDMCIRIYVQAFIFVAWQLYHWHRVSSRT